MDWIRACLTARGAPLAKGSSKLPHPDARAEHGRNDAAALPRCGGARTKSLLENRRDRHTDAPDWTRAMFNR